jgi:hypothetical protein
VVIRGVGHDDICDMEGVLANSQPYAQIVQGNTVTSNAGRHSTQSENGIKERMEKLKSERPKTEVTGCQ